MCSWTVSHMCLSPENKLMVINVDLCKVKHIIEIPLDGSLLYTTVYFLILTCWHQPKGNVIKLVSV